MSQSLKVLIVEDEKILQEVYDMILRSDGHEVHTADNGAEGLQKLQAVNPDVVLLDLFMPVLDGKEFLRNFDKSQYSSTSIIVYSNYSDPSTMQELIDLGADRFILKSSLTPADLQQLIIDQAKA